MKMIMRQQVRARQVKSQRQRDGDLLGKGFTVICEELASFGALHLQASDPSHTEL